METATLKSSLIFIVHPLGPFRVWIDYGPYFDHVCRRRMTFRNPSRRRCLWKRRKTELRNERVTGGPSGRPDLPTQKRRTHDHPSISDSRKEVVVYRMSFVVGVFQGRRRRLVYLVTNPDSDMLHTEWEIIVCPKSRCQNFFQQVSSGTFGRPRRMTGRYPLYCVTYRFGSSQERPVLSYIFLLEQNYLFSFTLSLTEKMTSLTLGYLS